MSAKITAALIGTAIGIDFDENQQAIIQGKAEPGVVIAGASSGKTTLMAARVAYLIANGEGPSNAVLGLTFTNLAIGSFQKKVRTTLFKLVELLGKDGLEIPTQLLDDVDEPTIITYDAFAARIVREHGLRLGIEPDSTVLNDARREQLAAYVIQRTKIPLADFGMPFSTVLEHVLKLDDALSNYDLEIDKVRHFDDDVIARIGLMSKPITAVKEIKATAEERNSLLDVVLEFRDHKKYTDHLDYADIARYALALVRDHKSVRDAYAQQFKAVLLDEYQDTSVSQRELMRSLFADGRAVTAVGDPLQSIYTFRGASPYNIEEFVHHFPKKTLEPANRFELPVTYRNGPNVVALANRITAMLRAEVHPNVKPLEAAEELPHGIGDLHVTRHLTSRDEVLWLVEHIKAAAARGVPLERMAILLRTNDHVAWFYRELSAHDIPVQIRTKQGLLSIPEIAELIAYLRVIAEPAANSAWVRILTGSRWRIGNRDLALIGKLAQSLVRTPHDDATESRTLDDVLNKAVDSVDAADVLAYGDALEIIAREGLSGLSPEALARIQVLVKEIESLRRHTSEDIVDFVYRVGSSTGLFNEAHAHVNRVNRNMAANLRAFMKMISSFRAIDGSATLFSLLRFLKDSERHEKIPELMGVPHKGAVELMTVHSAKGLEYQVVALPRMSENIFPSIKKAARWITSPSAIPFALRNENYANSLIRDYPDTSNHIKDAEHKEFAKACGVLDDYDERRLAYVGITRAMETLLISTSFYIEGEKKSRDTSSFFDELREAADALSESVTLTPWAAEEDVAAAEPVKIEGIWPVELNSPSMQEIRKAAELVEQHLAHEIEVPTIDHELIQRWDIAIAALETEIQAAADFQQTISLPRTLSVTDVQRLAKNEAAFLDHLVRPMPQEPAPAATQGTTFHAWVEQRARKQLGLGAMPTLPGMEDYDTDTLIALDTENLKKFQNNFESSEWAARQPYDVEHPFNITIGGRLIKGKIDAIFQDGDDWILVDWKTNAVANADPLQLSLYRIAWAESLGIELSKVRAAFYYVALNETVYAEELLTRADVERLLAEG